MTRRWRCSQGHQWEADSTRGASLACPACGEILDTTTTPAGTERTLAPDGAGLKFADVPTLPTADPPSADGTRSWPAIPGYEVLGELGRGGMGVVYKARQAALDRVVALKMVLAGVHAGPQELARFHTEANALARLQHPHIVQIHAIEEQNGSPFLSLEFMAGGSLAQKLQGQPHSPQEAARLVQTLARAIHAAHQQGIVHRDLKPANVLLTLDGTPKITDFGLAKQLGSTAGRTQSGAILGTPAYMAPEQAAGKTSAVGPATDVYSLGAILYELLTGRPPFLAESPFDAVLKVLSDEVTPPSRLQSKLPRDLETICLKCLQKEPRKRYPSAEALADDLGRFRQGEPILARPLSHMEHATRWMRRRRELVWGLAGAMAAVCLSVLVMMVLWPRTPPADTRSTGRGGTEFAEEQAPLPVDLGLVPRDATAFMSIRVSDLLKVDGVKRAELRLVGGSPFLATVLKNWPAQMEAKLGINPQDIERATVVIPQPDLPYQESVIIVSMARSYDREKLLTALLPEHEEKRLGERTYYAGKPAMLAICFIDDRTFVLEVSAGQAAPRLPPNAAEGLESFLRRIPVPDAPGPLWGTLHLATQKQHVVIGLNPPPQAVREIRAAMEPGARQLLPLTEVQTASLSIRLESSLRPTANGDALQLEVRLHFPGEAQAKQGKQACEALPDLIRDGLRTNLDQLDKLAKAGGATAALPAFVTFLNQLELALRTAAVEQQGTTVIVRPQIRTDLAELTTAPQQAVADVRNAARRTESANNLKQIAIAMHNYHDARQRFPPADLRGKDGQPLLSWRVLLLPYLEQDSLYKQFHLDESWDSEHNKKLLDPMPRVFASVGGNKRDSHSTFYQVFTGKGTIFEGTEGLPIVSITDGTANTLLVVEAGEAVPWTKPADLDYDPKKPLPTLGGLFENGFHAAFADGAVQFIDKKVAEKTLHALITRNGAEPIDRSQLPK